MAGGQGDGMLYDEMFRRKFVSQKFFQMASIHIDESPWLENIFYPYE